MTKEMLVLVILFVLQIGAEFKNEINCGLKITNYIVGGTDAQTNEFPFMVSLQNKFSHFCGGSVLNKRWVLTAAHCIKIPVMFGRLTKPSDIQLVIGSTKTNADYIGTHRYGVEKWVIHGCFLNTYGDMMTDDITLLKTDRDIPLNGTNIGTICLPKRDANPLEFKMLIAGWGVWDPDEESAARKLQKAETTLQSEEFCQTYQWYRNFGIMGWILGKRICLVKKGMTACRGDSGGPAFQTINGRVYQFGIASFISVTIPVDNYCYKENPVMYLKTSVYVDWIQESIEKYTNSFETKIETKC